MRCGAHTSRHYYECGICKDVDSDEEGEHGPEHASATPPIDGDEGASKRAAEGLASHVDDSKATEHVAEADAKVGDEGDGMEEACHECGVAEREREDGFCDCPCVECGWRIPDCVCDTSFNICAGCGGAYGGTCSACP